MKSSTACATRRPRLEKLDRVAGFVVLELGRRRLGPLFSKNPLNGLDDLRKMKLFTWAGDADEFELWKAQRLQARPLDATSILLSLQTRLIDAVPTVPLMALWNQYFGLAPT
jgi:TRAP-type C4-dicarboxylate transport system substrate-binding protein